MSGEPGAARRVLVTNPVMQRDIEQFRPQLDAAGVEVVLYPVQQFVSEAELLPIVCEFDGTIAGDDQYTERVLRAGLPRMKVISKWGVGLDSIDLDAAARLGVRVTNSPATLWESVAEVAISYILMLSRKLHLIDRAVRAGGWPKIESRRLRGQTLGVVGFGAIGRGTADRALGLGMQVVATDIRMAEMTPPAGVRFAALDDVVAQADYLLISSNLTAENRGMIDRRHIGRMKPTASLVNVSRGLLVEEPALIEALQRGAIAGAALDVYAVEPLPRDHPFLTMEQVILGSHNASNLREANEDVNRIAVRNLLEGLGVPNHASE